MWKNIFMFLKSNKWMRILYIIGAVGLVLFLSVTSQSIKTPWFQCDSKSNINIDIKK